MLATATQRQQVQKATRKLVERTEGLVRKYRNFSHPSLEIKRFNPMEILEDAQGQIDPYRATKAAITMENFVKKEMGHLAAGRLDETSRASMPAWVKNGLALIAAAQSEDPTDRVISVQAMSNRTGRIHYLDIVSERRKGNLPDRAILFDALAGWRGTQQFSSETIEDETIGAAGATTLNPTLDYGPVIPGSLVITDGSLVIRDNRNGLLIGDVGAGPGSNSVDYVTRAVSFNFSAPASGEVVARYDYNIEAAIRFPEYGIQLRAEEVQARPRALGASWSQQAVMDFMADFGIDAEPTIIEAGARIIQQERFKHVVNVLRNQATGGSVVFDNTAPTAVSYRDHLKTLGIYISRLQDLIWEATQTTRPNVMVVHPSIIFAIAFQDGWQGQRYANDGIAGPRYLGRLTNHDLDVFADPTYPRDQALLSYRGPEFVSTAAILGDYVPLYKAPVHVRGFHKDFALLSEYVIKTIDTGMIGTLQVVNL